MHTNESKKFDKRNIERNIKDGTTTQKEYEIYLSKLPDVSDKLYNPEEESLGETQELGSRREEETLPKKKGAKKKAKGKGR